MPNVALLGLGRMGAGMAASVAAAGFPLTVYNRTRGRADEVALAVGATVGPSPREAASDADIVVTMLSDAGALMSVLEGPDGVLASTSLPRTIVDMGTTGHEGVRSADRAVRTAGAAFLDAPVQGGPSAAASGELLTMVGAAEDDFEAVRSVLEAMSRDVYRVGPLGAGTAVKLSLNSLAFAINQGMAEALRLVETAGVNAHTAYEIVSKSPLYSDFLRFRRELFLDSNHSDITFTTALQHKDLELIGALAEHLEAHIPQARATAEVVRDAIQAGFGDKDMSSMLSFLGRRS